MVLGIFHHNEVSYRWKELFYNCVTVIYNMLAWFIIFPTVEVILLDSACSNCSFVTWLALVRSVFDFKNWYEWYLLWSPRLAPYSQRWVTILFLCPWFQNTTDTKVLVCALLWLLITPFLSDSWWSEDLLIRCLISVSLSQMLLLCLFVHVHGCSLS